MATTWSWAAVRAAALARKRDAFMKGRTRMAFDTNRPLRRAVEIRNDTFLDASFITLLRRNKVMPAKSPAMRRRDVYCFFDNTNVKLRAPFDAQSLAKKLGVAR